LTLYILRKLMYLLVDDAGLVDIFSIIFVLSAGVLQSISFLRMYVMAMFWVTLIAYLFVRAFDEDLSWKQWTQIGLTAIGGALTHYYCIIYLCATCLVFGIYLLVKKRWRDAANLTGYMVLSGVISLAIFPAMYTHMFSGYRGTQSIDNLKQGTWAEYWERIKSFYGYINTQMLGKVALGGIIFAILVVIAVMFLKENHSTIQINFDKTCVMKWMVIWIPIVIYFLFVSKSAVYVTDRYLFPIYAVVLGIFLCMVAAIFKKFFAIQYVYIAACLLGAVFIVNGFGNAKWEYLYKNSADLLNKAKAYSDRNCISVYDQRWKEQTAYCELKNYKSLTFISQDNIDSILKHADLFENAFMLNVIGGNDDRIISMIQSNYPYLDKYEKIGGFDYSTTYRIYAGDNSLNVHIHNFDRSSEIGADSFEPGANAQLTQNEQSTWLIRQDEDHAIIEVGTKVLDVTGGVYEEGTNIQMYTVNGSDNQSWKFIDNEDGSFSLLAKDERFAMTYGDDGNIYLAEYHEGENSQKWWVE
ncbi:MAG: RICIN domain-containing protein, partial [Lachnospiraceae bacterium]|nr:RICIN domain-containing protein [Lachnospiraceae bacterium]